MRFAYWKNNAIVDYESVLEIVKKEKKRALFLGANQFFFGENIFLNFFKKNSKSLVIKLKFLIFTTINHL